MDLTFVEARVLASLAEKQLTTPQQYPLTLNALQSACNQSTNRDPVVAFDEQAILDALSSLKERGLVRFVHPSHGRSAIRYRQVLEEAIGLEVAELAFVSVLVLRGPQTAGELRLRTERMAPVGDLAAAEHLLDTLVERGDVVTRLARRPGQKEERFAHLLTEDSGITHDPDGTSLPDADAGPDGHFAEPSPASDPPGADGADHGYSPGEPPTLASLQRQVLMLSKQVDLLTRELEALRSELGA